MHLKVLFQGNTSPDSSREDLLASSCDRSQAAASARCATENVATSQDRLTSVAMSRYGKLDRQY